MEELRQWSFLPILCVIDKMKELDFFDLKWDIIAESRKKYIQILKYYKYGNMD